MNRTRGPIRPCAARLMVALALALALAVALGSAGCSDGPPPREEVVGELAEQLVPHYVAFAESAAGLEEAVGEYCDAPAEATLEAARDALVDSREAWLRTEAFWLGPVMERRSWALVDWPVDTQDVDSLLADNERTIDAEFVETSLGAGSRGMQGLEYLLFADDSTSLLQDARRCDYLRAVSAVVASEASALSEAWGEDSGRGFAAEMPGDAEAVVDELVNDSIFLLEAVTDMELGPALGETGDRDPEALVEGSAGLGVADLRARLDGVRIVLVGPQGDGGLSPLLDDALAERLNARLADAEKALEGLDDPLGQQLEADPEAVGAAREALKALQVAVSTEVVGQLGVALGFSDADGDSAG